MKKVPWIFCWCDGAEKRTRTLSGQVFWDRWGAAGPLFPIASRAGLLDFIHWKLGCDYGLVPPMSLPGADLERLCERRIAQMLEGKHVAAFYLLWPARFDDAQECR